MVRWTSDPKEPTVNDADCVDLPIRLHPEIAAAIDAAAAAMDVDVDQFVTDALVDYAGSPASVLINGLPVGRVRVFRVPVRARDGLLAAGSSRFDGRRPRSRPQGCRRHPRQCRQQQRVAGCLTTRRADPVGSGSDR